MLTISSLKVDFESKQLLDISLQINRSLALVGESGSGKSLTLKALLGMLPANFEKKMSINAEFELKRGETVAFVPQNPFTALSPMSRIKEQFFCAKQKAVELLHFVGLDEELLQRYPKNLSGGQLQRVVIAMALSVSPVLLLLDEPTTALDASSKDTVLSVIKEAEAKMGFLTLLVTHDISVARKICDDMAVIKDGKIIEYGVLNDVVVAPAEAYTKELIEAGFENRVFRE